MNTSIQQLLAALSTQSSGQTKLPNTGNGEDFSSLLSSLMALTQTIPAETVDADWVPPSFSAMDICHADGIDGIDGLRIVPVDMSETSETTDEVSALLFSLLGIPLPASLSLTVESGAQLSLPVSVTFVSENSDAETTGAPYRLLITVQSGQTVMNTGPVQDTKENTTNSPVIAIDSDTPSSPLLARNTAETVIPALETTNITSGFREFLDALSAIYAQYGVSTDKSVSIQKSPLPIDSPVPGQTVSDAPVTIAPVPQSLVDSPLPDGDANMTMKSPVPAPVNAEFTVTLHIERTETVAIHVPAQPADSSNNSTLPNAQETKTPIPQAVILFESSSGMEMRIVPGDDVVEGGALSSLFSLMADQEGAVEAVFRIADAYPTETLTAVEQPVVVAIDADETLIPIKKEIATVAAKTAIAETEVVSSADSATIDSKPKAVVSLDSPQLDQPLVRDLPHDVSATVIDRKAEVPLSPDRGYEPVRREAAIAATPVDSDEKPVEPSATVRKDMSGQSEPSATPHKTVDNSVVSFESTTISEMSYPITADAMPEPTASDGVYEIPVRSPEKSAESVNVYRFSRFIKTVEMAYGNDGGRTAAKTDNTGESDPDTIVGLSDEVIVNAPTQSAGEPESVVTVSSPRTPSGSMPPSVETAPARVETTPVHVETTPARVETTPVHVESPTHIGMITTRVEQSAADPKESASAVDTPATAPSVSGSADSDSETVTMRVSSHATGEEEGISAHDGIRFTHNDDVVPDRPARHDAVIMRDFDVPDESIFIRKEPAVVNIAETTIVSSETGELVRESLFNTPVFPNITVSSTVSTTETTPFARRPLSVLTDTNVTTARKTIDSHDMTSETTADQTGIGESPATSTVASDVTVDVVTGTDKVFEMPRQTTSAPQKNVTTINTTNNTTIDITSGIPETETDNDAGIISNERRMVMRNNGIRYVPTEIDTPVPIGVPTESNIPANEPSTMASTPIIAAPAHSTREGIGRAKEVSDSTSPKAIETTAYVLKSGKTAVAMKTEDTDGAETPVAAAEDTAVANETAGVLASQTMKSTGNDDSRKERTDVFSNSRTEIANDNEIAIDDTPAPESVDLSAKEHVADRETIHERHAARQEKSDTDSGETGAISRQMTSGYTTMTSSAAGMYSAGDTDVETNGNKAALADEMTGVSADKGTIGDDAALFGLRQSAEKPADTQTTFANQTVRTGMEYSPELEVRTVESIVRHAALMMKNGQSSAVIRLEPPSLGKVKLEIVTERSKVTGRITVETQDAKQIIENRMAELKQNLNQNGLKVESFDVQVGHNGGGESLANRENTERFRSVAGQMNFTRHAGQPASDPVGVSGESLARNVRHNGALNVVI